MKCLSLYRAAPGRGPSRSGWLPLAACVLCLRVAGAGAQAAGGSTAASPLPSQPFAVKVMVVNMFGSEAKPWIDALRPLYDSPVPGLPSDSPGVHCTAGGVCQMTTGMGYANAAASLMAVAYSAVFDLRKTYFLIAGIGGISPERGTLGSAAWARYVVDGGITHEIDARELPHGWHTGFFGIYTSSPEQGPKFEYQTEMYQLDEALLQKALALSSSVSLEDAADMQEYRRRYPQAAARRPPSVIQCDTLSSDTWWSGARLGERARRWTRLLTQGRGDYCTTQQEDNATLTALTRAARSGRVDIKRVAVLRTGSDFDRPYPHQSAYESLRAQRDLEGAFPAATHNLVLAGLPLVEAIANDWDDWRDGVAK